MKPLVYLIANESKTALKIGYSSSIDIRVGNLQNCCWERLSVLNTIEGVGYSLESFLHRKFKKYHLLNEWFKYDNLIITEFSKMKQSDLSKFSFVAKKRELHTEMTDDQLVDVYSYILEHYLSDSFIALPKGLKEVMAEKLKLKLGTVNNAISKLSDKKLIYSTGRGIYRINPRYAFKGSTKERNQMLKFVLEMECPSA